MVTGAGGYLGRAIVDALAARGAALALVDNVPERLAVVRDRLDDARSTAVIADVTASGAGEAALTQTIRAFGRLDVVVNAAGVEGPIGPIETISLADVRRVFDVNVFGLLTMSQAALRHFKLVRRGRIVNVASGAGLSGTGSMASYSASKHAVVGLTRSIAQEVAANGITVNAVCPGCIESPMMERIESGLSNLAGQAVSFVDAIPMRRYAHPAEVGETVAYLALEAPEYITGTTLVIDGGLRA